MRATQRGQSIGTVIAPLFTRFYVMDIQKTPVLAAWHHTATAIAAKPLSTHRRRDRLRRSHRLRTRLDWTHVGIRSGRNHTDLLPIALGHLNDLGRHFDRLPTALLPPAPAVLAHIELDLVA